MAGDPKVAKAVVEMSVDMAKLRASTQQAKREVVAVTEQASVEASRAATRATQQASRVTVAASGGRMAGGASDGLSSQDLARRAAMATTAFAAITAATAAMNGNFSQAGESIGLMLTLARRINPVIGVGITLVSSLAGMWMKARDAAKEAAEAAKKLRMEQAEALRDSNRLAFSLVGESNLVGADERVKQRAAAIEENKKTTRAIEELEKKSGYDTLQTARDAADALLRTKLDHIDRVYFAEQRAIEKAAAERAEAEQAAHREELYRISREANAVEQRKIDEMARDEMEARRTRTRSIDSVVGGMGQSFAIGGGANEVRVEGQRKVIEILDDIRRGIQHRIAGTGAFAQ